MELVRVEFNQRLFLVRYFGALPVGLVVYLGVDFDVGCCGAS